MIFLLRLTLTLAIGVALGLAATYVAVGSGLGFGSVAAGPWVAWPRSGSVQADPYARAVLAKTGELPLALAEGLTFYARVDDAGRALDPGCSYKVTGAVPPARYWTLTVEQVSGRAPPASTLRRGYTSAEVTRSGDGRFAIAVARAARPGDWLPFGALARPRLVLRLYDTPITASVGALDARAMPSIARDGCP